MFKDAKVAGALFDFIGFLTTRDKRITLSSSYPSTPALDALEDWAKLRGLDISEAAVRDWRNL